MDTKITGIYGCSYLIPQDYDIFSVFNPLYQWGITTVTLDMKCDLTYTAMYPSATLDDERWYTIFGMNGGLTKQKWDVINVYTYTYIQYPLVI